MQGFAELEYGMLRFMGAIDDTTIVVTSGKFTSLFFPVVFFMFLMCQRVEIVSAY